MTMVLLFELVTLTFACASGSVSITRWAVEAFSKGEFHLRWASIKLNGSYLSLEQSIAGATGGQATSYGVQATASPSLGRRPGDVVGDNQASPQSVQGKLAESG